MEYGKEKRKVFDFFQVLLGLGVFLVFLCAVLWMVKPATAVGLPALVSYQGKLLNANNTAVTTSVDIALVLYDAPMAGTALYTAAGTVGAPMTISITPSSGIFSVNLGDAGTNPLDPVIFRDNPGVYLEVSVNGETLTPRRQITASPYAFNSVYVGGYAPATASTSVYIPVSDAQGHFQFSSSSLYTANIGRLTVTGTIVFPNNSITDAMIPDTITVSNYLALAGGTLTGSVAFGGNNITGLNNLTMNGTLLNNGLSMLAGGFISSVSSTVSGRLNVSGPLQASSTLLVDGVATFTNTSTFARGVGIATSSPLAKLTIYNGSILAEGTVGSVPLSGPGTRLMWVPSKAAFRAGAVTADEWDEGKIGDYSVAIGYGNTASNQSGVALGQFNTVSGGWGIGDGNTVDGASASALGWHNQTTAQYGAAIGASNLVTAGGYNYAYGYANNISTANFYNIALGEGNIISGTSANAAALGYTNQVTAGTGGIALGYNNRVSGNYAFALGNNSSVSGDYSGVINLSSSNFTATPLVRDNTLAILNGYVTIGNNAFNPAAITGTSSTLSVVGSLAVSGTSTLATTTVVGSISPAYDNMYDIGSSSTRWRYLNVYGGVFQSNGVTTSSLENHQLILGQTSGYGKGKFYVDSSGNVSVSGTLQVAGAILPGVRTVFGSTSITTSTVDPTAGAGNGADGNISMIINADGFPLIAYSMTTDIIVTKCGNSSCSSGNSRTTVVTGDNTGYYTSLQLGSDGLPVIAYQSGANAKIAMLHCGNSACSAGNTINYLGAANDGQYLSMAIGVDGLPAIAFYRQTGNDVYFIHCSTVTCSSYTTQGIDVSASINVGTPISLAIGSDGHPVMAYKNFSRNILVFARCGDAACANAAKIATSTLDQTSNNQGDYATIAVGSDGYPVVAYRDVGFNRLIILHCKNLGCTDTEAGQETNSVIANPGVYASLKIGVDGFPMVAYRSNSSKLYVYTCYNLGCQTGTSTLIDSENDSSGLFNSMVIGRDGRPLIAYAQFNSAYNVKLAQCAGRDCIGSVDGAESSGVDLGTGSSYFNNVYASQFWGKKFKVSAFDVAEDYPTTDPTLGAGDVVAFDTERPGYVRRAAEASEVIGIVSTQPGLLLSQWENSGSNAFHVPVALSGRVPVKVNNSHGEIHIGDRLELSATPGVAALASGKRTVAIAMDTFVSSTSGVITAFVNLDSGSGSTIYQDLTVNDKDRTITFGSSTNPYSLIVNGTVNVVDPSLAKLSFSTTTLLSTQVPDYENARAFILNAENFSATGPSDRILFSLRAHDVPVFSVAANGDVNASGNYYGQSATFGSSTNPGDLAERVDIAQDDTVEAGDVMVVDPHSPDTYRRSSEGYQGTVAGVISSNPTIVVGRGKTDYTANLAMVGRVPVKVVNENGSIKRGDLLVASSRSGYAMKYDPTTDTSARVVGIIGVALDPLTAESGKINALIRTGWVYSQATTVADLAATVENVTNGHGENIGFEPEKMGVSTSGDELVMKQNLNLSGHALLNVRSITGVNNTWEITSDGEVKARKVVADEVETAALTVRQHPDASRSTIGEAVIKSGESSVEVENARFSSSTKVFITFVSDPSRFWWISKKEDGRFTLSLETPADHDTVFDYWLIFTTPVDNAASSPAAPVSDTNSPLISSTSEPSNETTTTAEQSEKNTVIVENSATSSTPSVEVESSSSPQTSSTPVNP